MTASLSAAPPPDRAARSLRLLRALSLAGALLLGATDALRGQGGHTLTVSGTELRLNGEHFPYTGVSFFNAIYNPEFNRDRATRGRWMDTFESYGINVLRIWGQWHETHGFVDGCSTCTLYHPDGTLREEHVRRLKEILTDADERGMVITLALFSRESWNVGIRLDSAAYVAAAAALARELAPHRNLAMQVWNEHSAYVLPIRAAIKAVDPHRLVTNSPGYGGDLGDGAQNRALDFLTPHTTREGPHWELAPREIAYLLQKYRKPVVDDEPARSGTASSERFGGPRGAHFPYDHILRMYNVWQAGGYVLYHHDMFQTGYGTPPIPPSGVPDPEYNPYHRVVFEFLAQRARYGGPRGTGPTPEPAR